MCEFEKLDGNDAVYEARECCDRIATVLQESIGKAEQLGDREMIDRLTAAKAAADRGIALLGKLKEILETDGAEDTASSA
jgi:hypothetical protein